MSLSDRRTFLAALAALPLAGCQFRPVYGPGGPGRALRGRVIVEAPANRLEFQLVQRLEERLGRGDARVYRLDHQVSTRSEGIAVTGTNDITRVRINGSAAYTLYDAVQEIEILTGTVSSFTAYSTTGSTLASDAAERAAEDRLMVLLADRMVDEILAGAARFT